MGLCSGLCGGSRDFLSGGGFDDTDGNGLSHVTDSKTSQGGELAEGLHAHGLGGDELNNGGIAGLDELGVSLGGLTGTPGKIKGIYEVVF